ncbi:thiamine biosynthesis protein ThiI [Paenibacillus darwinianus]|uniref:Probable tRNA sulfurtransferase n=1 Tax=Paenibacillus darwinianus TaxID=1380763 RepID=A0A9W5S348_9BACL|nr:tRNA uracil 4-sulfurtransferase ThiI [Paenibacillus darwinianus]EXX91881.1 thiamine biosynthesis protein ThiI [Paenibacillus darwinianus]EXX92376.1 thiamine biosynthesis protein ThiI [Paenibacillus darwinianus]EXX92724.1 thiamine biosynthesis protein ThiI [Paenibacillus darwinianus]
MFDRVLLRFGEYMVKGKNRGRFESQMLRHVQSALQSFERLTVTRTYGRIYVALNGESYDAVADRLKDLFGIASFSPVKRVETELDAIREGTIEVMGLFPDAERTFKVSVRRVWKGFPHDSQEMNHLVGSHVLRATPKLKVDVRRPDVELRVEIHPKDTYIYSEVVPGGGGFPYGTNGKAVLLLSGGIDSPVAGWSAMRKGLELEAIHFYSYPFTSEQAKDKVVELAKRLSRFAGRPLKLHLVHFTDIQTSFAQAKQDRLIITLMRRAMLRIAERIALREGALAIVTGDSLGQVASQTLSSMNVIGRTVDLPLLRPLVMMDKQEIIGLAERIGTYETSILPYEDCCTLFVPQSPTTNPNLRVAETVESHIPGLEEMIEKAVSGMETLKLTPDDTGAGLTGAGKNEWF